METSLVLILQQSHTYNKYAQVKFSMFILPLFLLRMKHKLLNGENSRSNTRRYEYVVNIHAQICIVVSPASPSESQNFTILTFLKKLESKRYDFKQIFYNTRRYIRVFDEWKIHFYDVNVEIG